jgi:hypothetical protein
MVFSKQDSNDEEPLKANLPTWANNPDYTAHATSSEGKKDKHASVIGMFDNHLPVVDYRSRSPVNFRKNEETDPLKSKEDNVKTYQDPNKERKSKDTVRFDGSTDNSPPVRF